MESNKGNLINVDLFSCNDKTACLCCQTEDNVHLLIKLKRKSQNKEMHCPWKMVTARFLSL